jgi:hypothetical protein
MPLFSQPQQRSKTTFLAISPTCQATKVCRAFEEQFWMYSVWILTRAVEHNLDTKGQKTEPPPRRPDLSTFFSTLELVDTSDPQAHHNAHATPQPENVAAAFRLLANAFEMMRGRAPEDQTHAHDQGNELLANMIEVLRQNADDPPTEVKGVPNSFLDELERVPKKALKKDDTCPICVNPFLDGTCEIPSLPELNGMLMFLVGRQIPARRTAALPQGSSFRPRLHCPLAEAQFDVSSRS